jgi:hypothetical protein
MDPTTLITGANLACYGAILAILQTAKMLVPGMDNKWVQRFLPLLPLILGVAAAMIGMATGKNWQERVTIGIIIGVAAGQSFKLGKTTLLGKGLEPDAPKALPPTPAPAADPKPADPPTTPDGGR